MVFSSTLSYGRSMAAAVNGSQVNQPTPDAALWPAGRGVIFTPPEEIQRKFVRPHQFLEASFISAPCRLSLIMVDLNYYLLLELEFIEVQYLAYTLTSSVQVLSLLI